MADISKIKMPDNTSYDLKDAAAREAIAILPTDVRIDGISIVEERIANIPRAGASRLGVIKASTNYGLYITTSNDPGMLRVQPAYESDVKEGTHGYRPIVPSTQHNSVFYGLTKAAGVDMASSNNAIGTYTDEAKAAIQKMLGVSQLLAPVEDTLTASQAYAINKVFAYNGKLYKVTAAIASGDTITPSTNCTETTISETYIKNTDYATSSTPGVIKVNTDYGLGMSNGLIYIYETGDSYIKAGANKNKAITTSKQHVAAFYGLAKAAGDTTQASSSNAVGTYTDDAKSAIRSMLGAIGTTDYATALVGGVVKVNPEYYGINIYNGFLRTQDATSTAIKAGIAGQRPISPNMQHEATFYGLAKAAGDSTQSASSNAVGTYTDDAKAAIRTMLGAAASSDIPNVPVTDIQVNGTSIVENNIATIPIINYETLGLAKTISTYGIASRNNGYIYVYRARDDDISTATNEYKPIVPYTQHQAVYYGLAKLAGTNLANETVTLGTYPDTTKDAIQNMLGISSLFAPRETDLSAASQAYAIGDVFLANGKLYKATAAIAANDTIDTATNCAETNVTSTFVKKTDYVTDSKGGIIRVGGALKRVAGTNNGYMYVVGASESACKLGTNENFPLVPYGQHYAVFYGLSKIAGVDLKNETVTLGTYPETSKTAIRAMLGVPGDIQANGTSIVSNGIANIPVGKNQLGLVNFGESDTCGIYVNPTSGSSIVYKATSANIKAGKHQFRPIVPVSQHESVFYGLAKAAGDTTQAASENAVGTYTDTAQIAIQTMLGLQPGAEVVRLI